MKSLDRLGERERARHAAGPLDVMAVDLEMVQSASSIAGLVEPKIDHARSAVGLGRGVSAAAAARSCARVSNFFCSRYHVCADIDRAFLGVAAPYSVLGRAAR